MIKIVYCSSRKIINRYSCQILMKLEFFSTDFSKNTQNIKFHENPPSGSQVVSMRTDRQT